MGRKSHVKIPHHADLRQAKHQNKIPCDAAAYRQRHRYSLSNPRHIIFSPLQQLLDIGEPDKKSRGAKCAVRSDSRRFGQFPVRKIETVWQLIISHLPIDANDRLPCWRLTIIRKNDAHPIAANLSWNHDPRRAHSFRMAELVHLNFFYRHVSAQFAYRRSFGVFQGSTGYLPQRSCREPKSNS